MPVVSGATTGGPFTRMIAYFPPAVITAGDGHGGASCTGWVGSGSPAAADNAYADNGSSQWLTAPSSNYNNFTQGRKSDYWTLALPTGNYKVHDYSIATCEPHNGWEFTDVADSPNPSYGSFNVDFQAFYDNEFDSGEGGATQNAIRNSSSWVTVASQPGPPSARALSVKGYSANQVQFGPDSGGMPAGVPLSEFSKIRGRAWAANPLQPADEYTRVIYEEAFDIYQHYDNGGTVETMFWTYNHFQNPASIGPHVETVDFGDGKLWDLYVSTPTLSGGGAEDNHPYGIFYLQPEYQGDNIGWVDILAGLRYFCSYFVASAITPNPLNLPVWQITHGWELVNTNFQPVPFQMTDYRLEIS